MQMTLNKSPPFDKQTNEQNKSLMTNEMFLMIGSLCMILLQMSTCLSLVTYARGL